jgi:glycosyltransferase 2 family protein
MIKRIIRAAAKFTAIIVICYFISRMVWDQRGDLLDYFTRAGFSFYSSVIVMAVFLYVQARIWTSLVNTPEWQISGFRGSVIYVNAQFAKYVPGGVWNVVGRMMLASKHGVTLSAQLKSIYYENVLLVVVTILYGLILFTRLRIAGWYVPVIAGLAAGLFYMYYDPISQVAQRFTKRMVRRLADAQLFLSRRSFFRYLGCFLVSHLLMGTAFWLLLLSFGVRNMDIISATGTYCLAWLLGLLSPLPGGLGLREGALIYLLSLQAPMSDVYQIAIVARVWSLIAELLLFGIVNGTVYIGKRLKR